MHFKSVVISLFTDAKLSKLVPAEGIERALNCQSECVSLPKGNLADGLNIEEVLRNSLREGANFSHLVRL